ncbi:MAG TPA: hypothetical protein VNO79_00185 [Actinomycetota bacterium]|nr:hypothetical protein [Actinomycetota bacterium]
MALAYTSAIIWNPELADEAMWRELHRHFAEPELVELGFFVALTLGQQRWIKTLGIEHGEVLADTETGLAPEATRRLKEGAGGGTPDGSETGARADG